MAKAKSDLTGVKYVEKFDPNIGETQILRWKPRKKVSPEFVEQLEALGADSEFLEEVRTAEREDVAE